MQQLTLALVLLTCLDYIQYAQSEVIDRSDAYSYLPDEPTYLEFQLDPRWPSLDALKRVGAITAAVPTDPHGRNTLLLHRGDRVWDVDSFDMHNVFREKSKGPIKSGVLAKLTAGELESLHLANRFYMPHGLTVDSVGNVWITDVALHQVFKFSPKLDEQPLLVLGEQFRPGNDTSHFCKPTHVAVATDGHFFVADGYCNSRIMKFNATGKVVKQWGQNARGMQVPANDDLRSPYDFSIPHQLVLIEEHDLLCVADRENYRIACFVAGLSEESEAQTGEFVFELQEELNRKGPIYGLAYAPRGGTLFALVGNNGPEEYFDVQIYDLLNTKYLGSLTDELQGFTNAHSISACPSEAKSGCLIVTSIQQPQPEEDESANRRIWFYDMLSTENDPNI